MLTRMIMCRHVTLEHKKLSRPHTLGAKEFTSVQPVNAETDVK